MLAYAKALQFWVEKANLPTEGQPCLLPGSVVELREEMKCYISFTDEDVFSGLALPEESPITQPKEATPKGAQPAQAESPLKEATVDVTMEPTRKKKPPNWFPGWEKVLHLSRLVGCWTDSPLLRGPKQRPCSQSLGERLVQQPQPNEPKVQTTQSEPQSPTKELEIVQQVTPLPSFIGVTACLQRDQLLEEVCKVP